MNEEFVLPEYWYLKIDEENKPFIEKWRKEVFNFDSSIDSFYFINSSGHRGRGEREGAWGVGWLTTSQFIKYVYNPLFLTHQPIKEDYSYLIPFIQKLEIL